MLSGEHKVLPYVAFLLQGICQIAVSIWEVGLQFNSTAVGVNSQINEALLIVDTGQVPMYNRMVGAKTQGPQVSSHSSGNKIRSRIVVLQLIKYPTFQLQHFTQLPFIATIQAYKFSSENADGSAIGKIGPAVATWYAKKKKTLHRQTKWDVLPHMKFHKL